MVAGGTMAVVEDLGWEGPEAAAGGKCWQCGEAPPAAGGGGRNAAGSGGIGDGARSHRGAQVDRPGAAIEG